MGKEYWLLKEEVLRIPENLHLIYKEFKETRNIVILYYFIIQLFEFMAILSVNNYRRKKNKDERGAVGSYQSVVRYITSKSGVLRGMSTSLKSFVQSISDLRHIFSHDLNKYLDFEKALLSFLTRYKYGSFDKLFTIIETQDINVTDIRLDMLRADIRDLLNWAHKSQNDKKKSNNIALQQTAATSNSTLDAIANIGKKYEYE